MQNQDKQARKKVVNTWLFPSRMIATAVLASVIIVFSISEVFENANEPCMFHFSSNDALVVNTFIPVNDNVNPNASNKALTSNRGANEPAQASAVCNHKQQNLTWFSWVFKRSDSIEFYYLDFLELLSRK